MKALVGPAFHIFLKDSHSELRTRYALNALIMFVVTAITVIVFSLGSDLVTRDILSGILWVIIFFSGMSGLSRTFVSEEERGTVPTLQLISRPVTVYLGKLLFNLILILSLNVVIAFLYGLFIEEFVVQSPAIFWTTIFLGSLGIGTSSTIIAAIIAKANTKGTLYPVLSFPIMLPVLLSVMNATKLAVEGAFFVEAAEYFWFLICYNVALIAASILLFDYIWKE